MFLFYVERFWCLPPYGRATQTDCAIYSRLLNRIYAANTMDQSNPQTTKKNTKNPNQIEIE